jgi:broad specificity phosphatase PhoE
LKLNRIRFDKIYCSPLTRVRQTIAQLSHPVETIIVSELTELNTGEVSHITTSELYATEARYRYQGLNPDLRYPGGECLNDMLTRVQGWFIRERKAWFPGDSILIAGHEGTVCAILHLMMNLDITHYPTFSIGNCDYVSIDINQDGQVRYRFNTYDELIKEALS